MVENKGVVESAEWEDDVLHIKFKTLETDESNFEKLNTKEAKDLFSYLNIRTHTELSEKQIPLFKDVLGRWFIDIPQNYVRGNKITYKFRRFCMNRNLYKWNDNYLNKRPFTKPTRGDTKPAYGRYSCSYGRPSDFSEFSYEYNAKFRRISLCSSLMAYIFSLTLLFTLSPHNPMSGFILIIMITVSLFIIAFIMPAVVMDTYYSLFPQKTTN